MTRTAREPGARARSRARAQQRGEREGGVNGKRVKPHSEAGHWKTTAGDSASKRRQSRRSHKCQRGQGTGSARSTQHRPPRRAGDAARSAPARRDEGVSRARVNARGPHAATALERAVASENAQRRRQQCPAPPSSARAKVHNREPTTAPRRSSAQRRPKPTPRAAEPQRNASSGAIGWEVAAAQSTRAAAVTATGN